MRRILLNPGNELFRKESGSSEEVRSSSGNVVPAAGDQGVGVIYFLGSVGIDLRHFLGKSPGLYHVGMVFSDHPVIGPFNFPGGGIFRNSENFKGFSEGLGFLPGIT